MINTMTVQFTGKNPTVAHGVPVWAVVGLGRSVGLTRAHQVLEGYALPAGEVGQLLGIEYQGAEGSGDGAVRRPNRVLRGPSV